MILLFAFEVSAERTSAESITQYGWTINQGGGWRNTPDDCYKCLPHTFLKTTCGVATCLPTRKRRFHVWTNMRTLWIPYSAVFLTARDGVFIRARIIKHKERNNESSSDVDCYAWGVLAMILRRRPHLKSTAKASQ